MAGYERCGAMETQVQIGNQTPQDLTCFLAVEHDEPLHKALALDSDDNSIVRYFTGDARIWLVSGPDGCYGVYATRELAEQHKAAMSDPSEFTVEHDIVRHTLMPLVAEFVGSVS